MVGTAYLDDDIWPQYATAYAGIPVLSSGYPNETQIMAVTPDFIIASYNSAFREVYTKDNGDTSGIFSTVGPCVGAGSEWADAKTTCRPQLNAAGIGTYVFEDACEDKSLRPETVREETVYRELRTLGGVFGVDVEPIIDGMLADFAQASSLVSTNTNGAQLKTLWLDCVGRCCDGDPNQVFVGGGSGVPHMLMVEAGLTNIFADRSGSWVCVNVSDVQAAAPDVIVVAHAAWDLAATKIRWLYNDPAFCGMEVLTKARLVSIPFSATTLSPRNGPAALDLARAALHVRDGSDTSGMQSGVCFFSPSDLETHTAPLRCPVDPQLVAYSGGVDGMCNTEWPPTTTAAATTAAATTDAASSSIGTAAPVSTTQDATTKVSEASSAHSIVENWHFGAWAFVMFHARALAVC